MASSHGSYQIYWLEEILCIELVGCFNREGTQEYIDDLKRNLANCQSPLSIILDSSRFEGCTEESYELLEQYNQWLNQKNLLRSKAIIRNTQVQESIANRYIPALKTQNIEYFDEKASALAWIKETVKSQ